MKNLLFALLSMLSPFIFAQKVVVSDSIRAIQKAAVELEARREAKMEKLAIIHEMERKELAEKQKTGNQHSVSPNFNSIYARKNGNVATGNCSSFFQSPGAITSFDQRKMVIDAPGYYYFTENVKWNPNHCPNEEAILILADDVILDLNGFTLETNGADTTRQFTGIRILASNNVTVKNGTISGMTYYGIRAELSKNVTIENIKVKNLKYYNVDKGDSAITPCGIILSTVNTFSIKNSSVQNLNTTSSSCAGIQIFFSKNGTMINDTVSGLKNYDGSVQGFSYIESDSIITRNCHASTFQSYYQGLTNTLGHTVLGFIPSLCHYLNYESCSAEDMTGSCDDCHGMSIFLDSAVNINNFSAKRIVDGPIPYNTGAKATGLEIYGYAVKVLNCVVDSIIATQPQDLQSTGFSAWGNNITFFNCVAKRVIVQNASGIPDTTKGYGTGFGYAPDPRTEFDTVTANQISYINCSAVDCQLGFDTWFHTNSIWNGNVVQNCLMPVLIQSKSAKRTLTMNKCSESPNGQPYAVILTNKAKNNQVQQFPGSAKRKRK